MVASCSRQHLAVVKDRYSIPLLGPVESTIKRNIIG